MTLKIRDEFAYVSLNQWGPQTDEFKYPTSDLAEHNLQCALQALGNLGYEIYSMGNTHKAFGDKTTYTLWID